MRKLPQCYKCGRKVEAITMKSGAFPPYGVILWAHCHGEIEERYFDWRALNPRKGTDADRAFKPWCGIA